MNRHFGRGLVLLALLSCQTRQSAPPPAVDFPASPHRFVIEGTSIQYNDKPLRLHSPVHSWVAALGPPSRDFAYGDRNLVWDELGVYLRSREDGLVTEVGWMFQGRNPPIPEGSFPYLPHRGFSGRLVVDGAVIHKDIADPVMDIKKRAPSFHRSYRPRLYDYFDDSKRPTVLFTIKTNIGGGIFIFIMNHWGWGDREGTPKEVNAGKDGSAD